MWDCFRRVTAVEQPPEKGYRTVSQDMEGFYRRSSQNNLQGHVQDVDFGALRKGVDRIYIYQDTIVGGTLNGGRVRSCNVLSVHWLHEWVEGPVYNDSVGAHFDREAGNRSTESNWKLLRADHFGCSPVEQRKKTAL